MICRACRGRDGEIVLDLGRQPACDTFPWAGDRGPDPLFPLRMWLCADCALAQLAEDPTTPAEPRGVEPVALAAQAADAVARVAAAGLLPAGLTVAEYGSPHGGSWLPLLAGRGLHPVGPGERAEAIIDCFGLMHAADQAAAITERSARLTDNGILLAQYHSLATIIHTGQWNALRHGHFGYYSAPALAGMLRSVGLVPRSAWRFDLYGGTVLMAASRTGEPDDTVRELLAADQATGVTTPAAFAELRDTAARSALALRDWLADQARRGARVVGYGAASRAVALLCRAGVDAELLPAVADAAPAKWGRRMPGTHIPVIPPNDLRHTRPDALLLFVPDLLTEVRAELPELADSDMEWVLAEPEPRVANFDRSGVPRSNRMLGETSK
jgi:hypothetical protein